MVAMTNHRLIHRSATFSTTALFTTLQQTSLTRNVDSTVSAVAQSSSGILGVLRLDGDRVDAKGMHARTYSLGKAHVLLTPVGLRVKFYLNMERRNHLGVAELPDVQLVDTFDTRNRRYVFLDLVEHDAVGNTLEQDLGGGLDQREGGQEDDDRDDEGDEGIGVVCEGSGEFVVGTEPDEESGENDTHVA